MKRAFVKHEIGGRRADGRAIHHQTKMRRRDVIAARLQTIGHRHAEADLVTLQAGIDTGVGFAAESVHGNILAATVSIVANIFPVPKGCKTAGMVPTVPVCAGMNGGQDIARSRASTPPL